MRQSIDMSKPEWAEKIMDAIREEVAGLRFYEEGRYNDVGLPYVSWPELTETSEILLSNIRFPLPHYEPCRDDPDCLESFKDLFTYIKCFEKEIMPIELGDHEIHISLGFQANMDFGNKPESMPYCSGKIVIDTK